MNIGDVGHTPGALCLCRSIFPKRKSHFGRPRHGSRELLTKNFPKPKIAEGTLDENNKPTTPELSKAWDESDLYLSVPVPDSRQPIMLSPLPDYRQAGRRI